MPVGWEFTRSVGYGKFKALILVFAAINVAVCSNASSNRTVNARACRVTSAATQPILARHVFGSHNHHLCFADDRDTGIGVPSEG